MMERKRRAGWLAVSVLLFAALFAPGAQAKVYKSYDDVLKSGSKAEVAALKAALEKAGYSESKMLLDGPPTVFVWLVAPIGPLTRYIAYNPGGGGLVVASSYPAGGTFSWSYREGEEGEWEALQGSGSQTLFPADTIAAQAVSVSYTCAEGEAGPAEGLVTVFAGDVDIDGIVDGDPEEPSGDETDPGALIGLNGARRKIELQAKPAEAFPVDSCSDYHTWTVSLSVDSPGLVEFWDAAEDGNRVTDLTWQGYFGEGGQWQGEEIPSELHVQGIVVGFVNVTLHCSADDHLNLGVSTHTDTVKFTVVDLKILQNGQDITNTTHDEIVGKKISLEGQLLPVGLDVDSQQWTIPGEAIANFFVGPGDEEHGPHTPGQVVPLGDLSQDSVDFYWHDGGDGRQVHYTITLGEDLLDCVATFDVKRPTATMSTTTGTVSVNRGTEENYYLALRFGDQTTPGIAFSAHVEPPTGFQGTCCFVQIYDEWKRRHAVTLGEGYWERVVGVGLDTTFPYQSALFPLQFDPDPATDDAPDIELISGYDRVEVQDGATMWLMFKPDGYGSIWVPLRKVFWFWKGAVRTVDGMWELDPGSDDHSVNPESIDTTGYPEWTRNFVKNEWEDEP